MYIRTTLIVIATFAAMLAIGCRIPVQRNDWSSYAGPGAEYFQREEFELPFDDDPLEPLNRVFAGINLGVMVAIVDPLATGWRFLMPQPVRTALVNASNNIEYPRRGVNHLLQGDIAKANSETRRFGLNTTVGVLGLGDPAGARGLAPAYTDTGMTFNRWGWRQSAYCTLPFGTPGTVRDVVGSVGDVLLDPTTYLFPLGPVKGFVLISETVSDYKRFALTSLDFYDRTRRLWTARRWILPERPPSEPASASQPADPERVESDAAVQTVRYAGFSASDPWFPFRARTHAAHVDVTGRRLPYDCYLQPIRSPVAFVVPGFGGHRQSGQVIGLVELLYRGGYAVVVISSPTHVEFMRNAASLTVPGFLPEDSRDVRAALESVGRDFDRRYGGRVHRRVLVGTSLGGACVLSIAAAAGTPDALDFDAYLAIHPPVQLRHAAEILDACYNTPLSHPPEQRDDRVAAVLQKAISLEIPRRRTGTTGGPLDPDEARFLIGLYYRLALHDVIWVSQERLDMGVLKTERRPMQRAPASQEILDFSIMEYAYAFLLPQMLKRDVGVQSADDLFARSDLRFLETQLRQQPDARVVCNANDILLSAEDVAWLRGVFGADRLIVHADGGHMGNLDDPNVGDSILRLLEGPSAEDPSVRPHEAQIGRR